MSLPIQLRGVDVAVIPAYQPTGILLDLVREVTAAGCEVIVVNDGSSRASRPIFEQLKEMPDVTVLRHAVNAGKGAALKTAFRYIRDWKSPDTFIATMDADGQHLPADLQRVLLAARLHPGALVLGARTFGRGVPLRSRVGNKAACILFRAAGGPAGVTDTQTGLRAFGYPMLDSLLAIGGDGYEYEMNVLLHCRRRGIPIQEVPIRTLYLDEQNSSSHFHPLRDSWKVVKTMLRFASASLASFALDYGLFLILHGLTRGFGGGLLFSNVAARLGSGAFNYLLNRRLVFHDQGDPRRSLAGYLLLAAGILLANNAVLALYTDQLGLPAWMAKICTELTLFLVSLTVQAGLIFRKTDRKKVQPHGKSKPPKLA